jgi:2'-5' RNA ligase
MGIVDRGLGVLRRALAAPELSATTANLRDSLSASMSTATSAPPIVTPYATSTTDVTATQTHDINDPNKLTRSGPGGLDFFSTGALINALTGVGTQNDPAYFNGWSTPRPLDERAHQGMGRNALIAQALGKLPNTATREGWRVQITEKSVAQPEEYSDQIQAYESRLGIGSMTARAIFRGRQYGGAIVLLGVEDGRDFSEPVDWDNVQSVRWAVVVDKRDYDPHTLYQATSNHYGKIETFRINDINGVLEDGLRYGTTINQYEALKLKYQAGGTMVVHASRVLHFPTPDYLSALDSLQDSLAGFFTAMSGISTAARESNIVVYKIKDWLAKALSSNAGLAHAHMTFVDKAKSVLKAWVIDKDLEDVQISSRSLGGVSQLPDPFMVWVAAALGIPVTVFWGVSPGGFGKGESERETWFDECRAFQKNILTPELTHIHALILVAKDGCRLPRETERVINYEDLSPPDEKTRSELRSKAIADATTAMNAGGMSRLEYRSFLEAQVDDYFRFERTLAGDTITPDALVGIFQGTLAILQAVGAKQIPHQSAQEILPILASSFFTPEKVAKVMAPFENFTPAPVPGAPMSAPTPGDEEDATTAVEPNASDLVWAKTPMPSDAEEGIIEGWIALSGKPRYSRSEVQRAILQGNGKLPSPELMVGDVRDGSHGETVVVVLRAPKEVAQWVPYKEKDSSAPHVTALYIGKVGSAQVIPLLDALRIVAAKTAPFTVEFDKLDYFTNEKQKRIAHLAFRQTAELLALHAALREVVNAQGLELELKHADKGYRPHLTLAYLEPGESYEGPLPPNASWKATEIEFWHDDLALPIALTGKPPTGVEPKPEPLPVSDTDAIEARRTLDPFVTEHAARQRDPDDFVATSFRRKAIAEGVDIIVGKLKAEPDGSMVTQSYRFDAEKFTPEQARKWLAEHDVVKRDVEPAKDVPEVDLTK